MFAYIPNELSLLQSLAPLRQDWLNPLMILLNQCDTGPFYVLLGAIGLIFYKPKFGFRLWLFFALAVPITHILKHLLLQPRPFILDPSLSLIKFNSLYGLPSGAAMCAAGIATLICHETDSRSIKVAAWSYAALIMFSRVYLAVHFISDVVVGCLLGVALSKLFLRWIEPVEQRLAKIPHMKLSFILLGVLTASHLLVRADSLTYLFAIGLVIGVVVSQMLPIKLTYREGLSHFKKMSLLVVSIVVIYGALYAVKHYSFVPVAETVALVLIAISTMTLALLSKQSQHQGNRLATT